MKKTILIITTATILSSIALIGAMIYVLQDGTKDANQAKVEHKSTQESKKKDVREAVWEQLSSGQKEWIGGTWEDGIASKDIIENGQLISFRPGVDAESYKGKEVYVVSFDNGLTGMFAITDLITYEIIGYYPYD